MAHRILLTVNNFPPVVTPASFSVTTPSTAGFVVGTVQATNAPTAWAITAGDPGAPNNFFAIDSNGQITVTAAGAVNMGSGTANLTVRATNAGGNGTATVTIAYQPVQQPSTFLGNPNPFISSINVSGGIAARRTSGQVPCFIHVSAMNFTAIGTSDPYGDLSTDWDFGDPGSVELMTDWKTGQTINTNNGQTGRPEAVHKYTQPGVYTVTATVRGQNGPGGGVFTATKTLQINVTAFNAIHEYWVDFSAGVNGSGSQASPFNNMASINTALGTSDTAIHIKRGTSTASAVAMDFNSANASSRLRIDAYGSGTPPVLTVNSGTAYVKLMTNGGNRSDIVISNIKFTSSSSGDTDPMFWCTPGSANFSDIYIDNCTFDWTGTKSGIVFMPDQISLVAQSTGYGFWNVYVSGQSVATLCAYGFFGTWGFIVGGHYGGNGSDSTRDHHLYTNIVQHGYLAYIDFLPGPWSGRNYCINMNYGEDPVTIPWADGPQYAEWICIANCNFRDLNHSFDASNSYSSDPSVPSGLLPQFRNVVACQNVMHNLGIPIYIQSTNQMTFRDNDIFSCSIPYLHWTNQSRCNSLGKAYRNRFYVAAGQPGGTSNALWRMWQDAPGTLAGPQTFTDNVIQDMRSNANVIEGDFTQMQSKGCIINRNQFYTPNDVGGIWYDNSYYGSDDGGIEISQATYVAHGFDTTISRANPGWSNPAIGQF